MVAQYGPGRLVPSSARREIAEEGNARSEKERDSVCIISVMDEVRKCDHL